MTDTPETLFKTLDLVDPTKPADRIILVIARHGDDIGFSEPNGRVSDAEMDLVRRAIPLYLKRREFVEIPMAAIEALAEPGLVFESDDRDRREFDFHPPLFIFEGDWPPELLPKHTTDIPAGRVLAHNHIAHTVDMPNGLNGFRCWTWPQDKAPPEFKPCKCGWADLPHLSLDPDIPCITSKQLEDIP